MILPLRNDTKLETILDTLIIDIDDDGEKEFIVVTHLGGIYILKMINVSNC